MAHVPPEQDESQSPSTQHRLPSTTNATTAPAHLAERRAINNDLHITIPQPPTTTTTAPTAPLITNSPTSFTHSDGAVDPEKHQQERPTPARSMSRPLFEPLRNRPQVRQTFAEGMNQGIQSLRRTVFKRTHSTKDDRYNKATPQFQLLSFQHSSNLHLSFN